MTACGIHKAACFAKILARMLSHDRLPKHNRQNERVKAPQQISKPLRGLGVGPADLCPEVVTIEDWRHQEVSSEFCDGSCSFALMDQ
jgi:hypothetical protein